MELTKNNRLKISRAELPLDRSLAIRLACLEFFSSNNPAAQKRLRPTPYQTQRLALLLAILDRLEDGALPTVDTRAIAAELVFPGTTLPRRAIEWKTSGLRRQSQRLVAAAKAMSAGGYKNLLHGRVSSAFNRDPDQSARR